MAKVLILEDEFTGKTYRDYLMQSLPTHTFVWCRTIVDAQNTINDSYSVVVLDQRLENNESDSFSVELGTTFMQWCKNKYPHIIGIMLSTHVTREALTEAYNNGWISRCLEKTTRDLAKLPGEVRTAIDTSECLRVMSKTDTSPTPIGAIRSWRSFFAPIKVYKVSDCIVDNEYIEEKSWETILTMHAGQKKSDRRKRETTHIVTVKCDSQLAADISMEKVKDILTKSLKAGTSISTSTSYECTDTVTTEEEITFDMPAISPDPNTVTLSSQKIQVNRIYEVRVICLKVTCPICKHDRFISCEVRIPTNREKQRKISVYSDGTKKITDV